MGLDVSTFVLDNIDCMKDLEIARHNIALKKDAINNINCNVNDATQPLLLGFGETSDEEQDFTPVISKRTRRKQKSAIKLSINPRQEKEARSERGAQSKSSAASEKVHNNHPLCDIVSGSRVRKKFKISMIGASLNCRGVGNKGMSTFLQDLVRSQMLDFVGLQETVKKDYSQAFFRNIDPMGQFCWKWPSSIGRAGGILGDFRIERFDVRVVSIGRFIAKVTVFLQENPEELVFGYCLWSCSRQ
jgi:hypothetical protein